MNFRFLTSVLVMVWLMSTQVSAQLSRSFSAVFSTDWQNVCAAGQPAATYSATHQSIGQCALLCSQYPGCVIYNYFKDTTACELFTCPSNVISYFDIKAFCKAFMDDTYAPAHYSLTDGSGYVLFQRRADFSLVFDQLWGTYKSGFGNICGNYWLGNEPLYQMTVGKSCSLRMEMITTNGIWYTIRYSSFYIDSEAGKYKLHTAGYTGNLSSDPLINYNGIGFSTSDVDNDQASTSCATTYGGGWWYSSCHDINFNCHQSAFKAFYEFLKFGQMWVQCV